MNTAVRLLTHKTQAAYLKQAAEIIKNGGLVAFPTETVYGLGANALDEAACAKIYAAKGRPSDNPLIMHISEDMTLDGIVQNISPEAAKLMEAFWPGSLTIIFQSVPRGTFSDTVGVRMPKNLVARLLIHYAGVPIAAPSANLSGRPSPTTAAHVLEDLDGKIDMILDGGPCEVGLESTVIDCSGGGTPTILRPGAVTREMIESVIGPVGMKLEVAADETPKSPGMKYRHYAPKAKVTVVTGEAAKIKRKLEELACASQGKKVRIVTVEDMGGSYEAIAANLFDMLRMCDEIGLDEVFVEGVTEEGLGVAIMNRLKKAASYNVLKV